jgi:hypothetical protein
VYKKLYKHTHIINTKAITAVYENKMRNIDLYLNTASSSQKFCWIEIDKDERHIQTKREKKTDRITHKEARVQG